MKIVIAQMQHETNTFSPVPTPWEAFGKDGPALGKAAYEATKGTRVPMAAFLDLAEAAAAEIVTPLAAWANPSGPVDGKAYDRVCDVIGEAVSKGCDAIFLDLHGAMVVADRTDDGEGTLLQKIRAIAPRTPIAVSLDRTPTSPGRWCATATPSPATRPTRTWTATRPASSPGLSCCATWERRSEAGHGLGQHSVAGANAAAEHG